jgi:lipopolysaccharide export system protein LptC
LPKKPKSRSYSDSRNRRLAAKGSGYTWFVRVMKIALPLAAIAIVGGVVSRLSKDPQIAQLAELPKQEKTVPGQIELVKAQYEGMDAKGRKYTVTADTATRDMAADEAVFLEKPRADIALEGGSWLAVHAAKGRFDNKASKLFLSGGVTAYHDSGYEMHLQDLSVDVKARAAASLSPVSLQGPAGELRAQNIAVTGGGELVVFGGPAQVTLHRLKVKPERKPG